MNGKRASTRSSCPEPAPRAGSRRSELGAVGGDRRRWATDWATRPKPPKTEPGPSALRWPVRSRFLSGIEAEPALPRVALATCLARPNISSPPAPTPDPRYHSVHAPRRSLVDQAQEPDEFSPPSRQAQSVSAKAAA